MTGPEGKRTRRRERSPYYPLQSVRQLVRRGEVDIPVRVIRSARADFGWDTCDILDAVSRLREKHFFKTAEYQRVPGEMADYYKARGLNREDVYVKFHVNTANGRLTIQSCKHLLED